MIRWFFALILFLFPCFGISVQALQLTPDGYLLKAREDHQVARGEPTEFLGYFPSSFEAPHLIANEGVRAEWFKAAEMREKYYLRPSAHIGALYQTEYREALMGSDQWPVKYSDLLQNSEGLHASRGTNGWASLEGRYTPVSWLALKSEIIGGTNLDHRDSWYQLKQLSAEILINRFILSAGRKPLFWGQNATSPLLQSLNAQNLDMIELSTLPVELPWFFKHLGPMRTEFFVARMNADRVPSNDYFTGWRLGMKPAEILEINIAGVYEWGGSGVPEESFSHGLTEYLGGRVQTGASNLDTSNFFNRAGELDIRLVFSKWKLPTSFYTEMHLEDCCGNPIFLLKKSISYSYGVLVRSDHEVDASRFRIEYVKTANAIYSHLTWPSAASNEGRLQGNELGRDAQQIFFEFAKEIPKLHLDLSLYSFWRERLRTGKQSSVDEVPDIDTHQTIPGFTESEKSTSLGFNLKYGITPSSFIDLGAQIIYVLNKRGAGGDNRIEGGSIGGFTVVF